MGKVEGGFHRALQRAGGGCTNSVREEREEKTVGKRGDRAGCVKNPVGKATSPRNEANSTKRKAKRCEPVLSVGQPEAACRFVVDL